MNILRKNCELAFCFASPERVIKCLKLKNRFEKTGGFYCDYSTISADYYTLLFRKLATGYSLEEIHNLFKKMKQQTKALDGIAPGLFQLLVLYGSDTLELDNGVPICRRERILGWRSTSLRMGQDIFTAALLAYKKATYSLSGSVRFDYPALIKTNDVRLERLLQKGIAENHFHLAGSTRQFPLSWIVLMNNPGKITGFFNGRNKMFAENRSRRVVLSDDGELLSWEKKLYYAAWIRAQLFRLVNGIGEGNLTCDFFDTVFLPGENSEINNMVMSLRLLYGLPFKQPDGKNICLDYAIKKNNCNFDINSNNRFLWGERELLYECFLKSFTGEFNEGARNLFYLYLLIKNQFRAEMVQMNNEVGFANFSIYQDRKDAFWGDINEYWAEAQRLAVNASLEDGTVKSLEMRLKPQKSVVKNYNSILEEDELLLFSKPQSDKRGSLEQGSLRTKTEAEKIRITDGLPFFYVLHFIKGKLNADDEAPCFDVAKPRNHRVRESAKLSAVALSKALEKSSYLCSRVRGIDAASFEIGCRPETFATAFRYLRNYTPYRNENSGFIPSFQVLPKLGITYHAGEDFLDIPDGLRAIDEAVKFLQMKRGDRLGHALALGIDPRIHYAKKDSFIALPKQDMLDNLVWMLKRSVELNIDIHKIRPALESTANQLLREIYGECIDRNNWNINLDDYYNSWKLRGDNPELYSNLYDDKKVKNDSFFVVEGASAEQYKNYYQNGKELDVYRNQPAIKGIMHYYHYGNVERIKGEEIFTMSVTDDYMELIALLQSKMQEMIANMGIAIECNLSSNQLIGTFTYYENHPIFRFNDYIISDNKQVNKLSVSLNTDDQGVFDTSLENEYAILVECMAKMKVDGKRKYNDDTIYQYVDHVREMGMNQVFPK